MRTLRLEIVILGLEASKHALERRRPGYPHPRCSDGRVRETEIDALSSLTCHRMQPKHRPNHLALRFVEKLRLRTMLSNFAARNWPELGLRRQSLGQCLTGEIHSAPAAPGRPGVAVLGRRRAV